MIDLSLCAMSRFVSAEHYYDPQRSIQLLPFRFQRTALRVLNLKYGGGLSLALGA
jgi:hypothetical protein